MTNLNGIIYKGIGGFYYVKTADGILECKARGIFRKDDIKPLPGDRVKLGVEGGTYYIDEIEERKNCFMRPPVANIDNLFIVVSTTEPVFSPLLVDKMLVCAYFTGAEPAIIITKTDLAPGEEIYKAYEQGEYKIIEKNIEMDEVPEDIDSLIKGKLSVFCGNSGVGKSTVLNALIPHANRETGETSKKLGRGRHTTREVEIFESHGGLIADTPGFASLNLQQVIKVTKEELQDAFPEISVLRDKCRYGDCAHIGENECGVRDALEKGDIAQSRYESYKTLYDEAKNSEKY